MAIAFVCVCYSYPHIVRYLVRCYKEMAKTRNSRNCDDCGGILKTVKVDEESSPLSVSAGVC